MDDRRARSRTITIAAALCGASLAACTVGSSLPSTSATASPGSTPTVTLQNDEFQPEELTVTEGTTVEWEWADGPRAHNVVGDGFSSDITSDGTFEHRFDEAGTYAYSCTLHAGMDGTVVVEPAGP